MTSCLTTKIFSPAPCTPWSRCPCPVDAVAFSVKLFCSLTGSSGTVSEGLGGASRRGAAFSEIATSAGRRPGVTFRPGGATRIGPGPGGHNPAIEAITQSFPRLCSSSPSLPKKTRPCWSSCPGAAAPNQGYLEKSVACTCARGCLSSAICPRCSRPRPGPVFWAARLLALLDQAVQASPQALKSFPTSHRRAALALEWAVFWQRL